MGTPLNYTLMERANKIQQNGGSFMSLPPPGGELWLKMFKIGIFDLNIFSHNSPPGGARDIKLPPFCCILFALSINV